MSIAVILSAYNGEKYIRQQIDSILAQTDVDLELFIRDDGSHDSTVSILREYKEKYNNVHIQEGSNLGFRQSFIQEMLLHRGFDYYAFSDQDDFWENGKLRAACAAIETMSRPQIPTVYYSNLNIADEKLNIYKHTHLEKRKQSLASVIMRRSIAGCTMVLNNTMWEKMSEKSISDQMLRRGHDSFIISLCYSIGGCALCDEHAYIRYRQHQDNTSGGMNGPLQRIKKEWNALINKKGQESEIACAILNSWPEEIDTQARRTLELVANYKKQPMTRLRMLISKDFTTGDYRLTALGKFKILAGLL